MSNGWEGLFPQGPLPWQRPGGGDYVNQVSHRLGLLGSLLDPRLWQQALSSFPDPRTPEGQEFGRGLFGGGGAENVQNFALDWGVNPMGLAGMLVHHGSPHKWAPEPGFPAGRPRLDKIGTGEGVQAFGHGMYFSEHPAVARRYMDDLAKTQSGLPRNELLLTIDGKIDKTLSNNAVGPDISPQLGAAWRRMDKERLKARLINDLDDQINSLSDSLSTRGGVPGLGWNAKETKDKIIELQESRARLSAAKDFGVSYNSGKNLYSLDLPDERLPDLLDWDKPLSEQPERVRQALIDATQKKNPRLAEYWNKTAGLSPEEADKVRRAMGMNPFDVIDQGGAALEAIFGRGAEASEYLRSKGIPGLRYLDAGSRGAGEGTANFVIWDQSLLDEMGRRMAKAQGLLGDVPQQGAIRAAVDEATGLPLNPDGTVTVYHHTSKEAAEQIRKTGKLKAAAEPSVYVTTRDVADIGYGDTVVPINIDPVALRIDDEFPGGRRDFSIDVKRPGGSVSVSLANQQQPGLLPQIPPELPAWMPRSRDFEEARRAAMLPPEQGGLGLGPANTAAERARAMGFDIPTTHGQTEHSLKVYGPIETISPGAGKHEAGALYGADDWLANEYAGQRGALYPLVVRSGSLRHAGANIPDNATINAMSPEDVKNVIGEIDKFNASVGDLYGLHRYMRGELAAAEASGKEGVLFRQVQDPAFYSPFGAIPSDIVATQGPNVRSRFAAFNPLRRHEADLLASWLLPAAGLGGILGYLGSGDGYQ